MKKITFVMLVVTFNLALIKPCFSEESQYGWKYLKFGMDKQTVEKLLKENGDLDRGLYCSGNLFPAIENNVVTLIINYSRLLGEKIVFNSSDCQGNYSSSFVNKKSHNFYFYDNKLYAIYFRANIEVNKQDIYYDKIREQFPNGKNLGSKESKNYQEDTHIYQYISGDGKFGVHFHSYTKYPDENYSYAHIAVLYYDTEIFDKLSSLRDKLPDNNKKEELERFKQEEAKRLDKF